MSSNLIGLGADLQQKLDAMAPKDRQARWAGDVGVALFGISRKLHTLGMKIEASGTVTAADKRREQGLMKEAKQHVAALGKGVEVHRQPYPRG